MLQEKCFFHIFLFRLAKLCPNNFFKPAFVAVEAIVQPRAQGLCSPRGKSLGTRLAIVLFVLLCTLAQTSKSTGN
jgi:hypothetical protein